MPLYFISVLIAIFLCGCQSLGQGGVPEPVSPSTGSVGTGSASSRNSYGPIDVVSNTNGVDLRPYLRKALAKIKDNWYSRVPESAREPTLKKDTVVIKFKVLKDGTISDPQYATHSGDGALDEAAYKGIASSSPLPALPSDFGCRFVALQIRFQYNPGRSEPAGDSSKTAGLIPCVTSEIQFVGQIGISLTPSISQVSIGRNLQFLTTVTGLDEPKVLWKVAGSGCAAEACGEISSGGLYQAPLRIPNPPTIIVTATLENAGENASATVTIVPPTTAH